MQVCRIINELKVHLQEYSSRVLTMDMVVIDYPSKWGMLSYQKWVVDIGGCIKMDWSYATILMDPNYNIILFREKKMLHNVEDPR